MLSKTTPSCYMCQEADGLFGIMKVDEYRTWHVCGNCMILAKRIFLAVGVECTAYIGTDVNGICVKVPSGEVSVPDAIDALAVALKERM